MQYGTVSDKTVPNGARLITYKSFIIHAPKYIVHLANLVRRQGVTIRRHRLSSIEEAYDLLGFGRVSLVVNATGLGAKSMLGMTESKQLYPIRGQTVLVKAPEVKTCYMKTTDHPDAQTNKNTQIPEPTYIIPRPGKEGHVVL